MVLLKGAMTYVAKRIRKRFIWWLVYFPFFDDSEMRKAEKRLYGHHEKGIMKTDVQENDTSYNLVMDLPGFKKEDVKVPLRTVTWQFQRKRAIIMMRKKRKTANTSVGKEFTVPAQEVFMSARISPIRTSRVNSSTVFLSWRYRKRSLRKYRTQQNILNSINHK